MKNIKLNRLRTHQSLRLLRYYWMFSLFKQSSKLQYAYVCHCIGHPSRLAFDREQNESHTLSYFDDLYVQ